MNFINFTDYKQSNRSYTGNAGLKRGIIIDDENWFLKFPKNTTGFRNMEISYTTSPLSEYIGSQIYDSVGIDVHSTMLGRFNNKVVVACKDFRTPGEELVEFRAIKNDYIEGLEEKLSSVSDGSDTHLSAIIAIMDKNNTFSEMPELKERFWDMFVVDALIGNNDRNNGNWGLLINYTTSEKRLAPVYDNGASFSGKLSESQMQNILNDNKRFHQSVIDGRTCAFLDDNNREINPLKYIQGKQNPDCTKALARIMSKVNTDAILEMIDKIPNEVDGLKITSDIQKEFYKKCVQYRYDEILYPTVMELENQSTALNRTSQVILPNEIPGTGSISFE